MTSPLVHFLLVYDHEQDKLIHKEQFTDADEAVRVYFAKEQECRDRKLIEIVLIGSDSLATVRLTHANYFEERVGVSEFLVGI